MQAEEVVVVEQMELKPNEFILGGKKFEVGDLDYDSYESFLGLLQPLADTVVKNLISGAGVNVSGLDIRGTFSAAQIIASCGRNLPELARLICKNTEPDITTDEVKRLAKTPFILAEVVLKQVVHSGMLTDILQFFNHMLPLLKTRAR